MSKKDIENFLIALERKGFVFSVEYNKAWGHSLLNEKGTRVTPKNMNTKELCIFLDGMLFAIALERNRDEKNV